LFFVAMIAPVFYHIFRNIPWSCQILQFLYGRSHAHEPHVLDALHLLDAGVKLIHAKFHIFVLVLAHFGVVLQLTVLVFLT
jgi:hypothetical protein